MPINQEKLFEAVLFACKKEAFCETIKCSAGTGAGVSTCAAIGLVGGPIGVSIGGAIGVAGTYFLARNKYKSLVDVLMLDFTDEERDQLLKLLIDALKDVGIQDLIRWYMNYNYLKFIKPSDVASKAVVICWDFVKHSEAQKSLAWKPQEEATSIGCPETSLRKEEVTSTSRLKTSQEKITSTHCHQASSIEPQEKEPSSRDLLTSMSRKLLYEGTSLAVERFLRTKFPKSR